MVINSSRYAVIDAEGRGTEHELTLTEGDKLLTPESKHAALGVRVKDAVKHCIWAASQCSEQYILVFNTPGGIDLYNKIIRPGHFG